MRISAVVLAGLIVLGASPVFAQDSPPSTAASSTSSAPLKHAASYDARIPARLEISAGYTLREYSTGSTSLAMKGGYVSVDYNIFTWLGATAEGLGVFKRGGSQSAGTAQNWALFGGMAGATFYPVRHHKLTPFVHGLAGEGYYDLSTPAYGGFPSSQSTSTGRIFEFGGGLDLRIKRHWAVRIVEGDFGQTNFYGGHPSQTSYRISVGIVLLKGEKR